MKFLMIIIFMFFPLVTNADEFDWNATGIDISDVGISTESGKVLVMVGSNCYASDQCDIAAKFIFRGHAHQTQREQVEFVRQIANDKATLSLVDNKILITTIYYLQGHDSATKVKTWFTWNNDQKIFEQTGKQEEQVE
jgi:hypothetical protein